MNRKRILILSTAYYPFVGGAEVAIREIAERLSNFDFELITARLDKKLAREERIGKVLIHRLGFGQRIDKLFLPFWGALKIWQINRKNRIDLFWAMMVTYASGAAYIYNFLHFWKRVPIVLTLQEGDSEEHLRKRHFGLIDLSWRLALRGAKHLSVISGYLARRAIEFGYDREIAIIPNGVNDIFEKIKWKRGERDKFRAEYGLSKEDILLATTGRLVYKNGVDTLVRSLAYLPNNVHLLSIGSGEDKQKIDNLIKEYNLQKRVHLVKYVPQEELPIYLNMAEIFIRPSRSEGLGNSFLEAMRVGIPIIGTDVGGIPDFLKDGETGLFCEMDNPESIAEKVKKLLVDKKLAAKIIKNAKTLVEEKYSWEEIVNSFERLFIEACRYKFIIASPLSPRGNSPTRYALNLAKAITQLGHGAEIVTFSNRLPTGIRHLIFVIKVMFKEGDACIALDNYSIAFPALMSGKRVIVRIGGDFLWESYIERTKNLITLKGFYENMPELSLKEKITMLLSGFMYRHVRALVFSTDWQRKMLTEFYKLSPDRNNIFEINNFVDIHKPHSILPERPTIYTWIGRDIVLKNVDLLGKAFAMAQRKENNLELRVFKNLDSGEVKERLKEAHVFILPSVSDVSPNLVLEALSLGKPVIMTRESGIASWLSRVTLQVDPLQKEQLENAILEMNRKDIYKNYLEKIGDLELEHSYLDIAREFLEVYEKVK